MEPEFTLFNVNMRRLIENLYTLHDYSKVVIISHSFGSAVFRQFLSTQTQEWKDKHIHSWISVSGAFAGSVKAVHANTFGYCGKDWLPVKGKRLVASLMSTFPSALYIQRSKSYFGVKTVYQL